MIKLTEQVVPVKINGGEDRETSKKFKVRGWPTILFVNAQGKRVDKIVGYLPPDKFSEKLKNVITIHQELAGMKSKFDGDPSDLEMGSKLAAAYASSGVESLAKKVIGKLEDADPKNEKGFLTEPYMAMGDFFLDEKEEEKTAIKWFTKAVESGREPAGIAQARWRMANAYYDSRTDNTVKSKKFGEKLKSAEEQVNILLAMEGAPDELKAQAKDLAESIKGELGAHEDAQKKKDG